MDLKAIGTGKASINLDPVKVPKLFNPPLIKIGHVPISEQMFAWEFTPGPLPYRTHFQFVNELHDKIKTVKNPTTIQLKCQGSIGQQQQDVNLFIENVFLIEGRQSDKYHWQWEIQDMRFLWRGEKITLKANRTWKVNKFGEGAKTRNKKDPGSLREPFNRFASYRYIPWSVKKDGKPYTALELLKEAFKQLPGVYPSSFPSDNGYISENIAFEEEEPQLVLGTLCNWARCNIGVSLKGVPYVYSIDELENFSISKFVPIEKQVIEGGIIFKEDRSRTRPPAIHVKFRRKEEIIIRLESQNNKYKAPDNKPWKLTPTSKIKQKEINEGRAVVCQNIIKLPNDTFINGQWYQRNTYILMKDYLDALKISEELVRKKWFSDLLVIYHAVLQAPAGNLSAAGGPDPQAMMRVRAIQQHYRRVFQIDPYWVQRWESWENKRCTVVDPVSGFSSPSPVWQDFCLIPKIRPPSIKTKQKHLYAVGGYNWILSEKDPDRESPLTVASLRILDQELGIFEIDFPQMINDVIQEIIPSAVTEPPRIAATATLFDWSRVTLRENFELEAIISTVPAVDKKSKPTEKQFMTVSVLNSDAGEGPEIEYLSGIEVARYPIDVGLSEKTLGLGKTSLAEAKKAIAADIPTNVSFLVPIAQAEANRMFHGYLDRHSGFSTCAGVDINKLRLFGQCKGISVSFSRNGGLKTYYNVTTPPAPRNLQNLLPDHVRRYAYKQLPQTQ